MGHLVDGRRVLRVRPDGATEGPDQVAVEQPLTVRVSGATVATTMRTPGHDLDLAAQPARHVLGMLPEQHDDAAADG